jgi:hypothetical protein
VRRHPEGLRILQRPARHQRHHRLPGQLAAKTGIAPQTVRPNAATDSLTGYGPSDLQSAHGLTSAAYDAYDDPNAESDLANTHDSQALMPLSGASRRSAPPQAAPTPVGQAPRGKGCDHFHLR